MQDKKILITGGAGFLGSNLSLYLAKKGAQLVIADNLSRRGSELNYAKLKTEFPDIVFYEIEINDIAHVIEKERPDLIYHFAAQVAVTLSVVSPINDFRTNAEGTFAVARAAGLYHIPVIYTSTNKVYGDNVNDIPIKELKTRYEFDGERARRGIDEQFSIDVAHQTPYGCSKLVGELYVREWDGVVNRCSCMYGPHQYGIVDQGWISYFISQKLQGNQITIFGDGKQVRDILYIDDVVNLLVLQGERFFDDTKPSIRGEVFTIGGGYSNTISLLELCEILGIKPVFDEWRPSDQKVFYCDITKAKRVLGWEPKINYKDGIEKILQWTIANQTDTQKP